MVKISAPVNKGDKLIAWDDGTARPVNSLAVYYSELNVLDYSGNSTSDKIKLTYWNNALQVDLAENRIFAIALEDSGIGDTNGDPNTVEALIRYG